MGAKQLAHLNKNNNPIYINPNIRLHN